MTKENFIFLLQIIIGQLLFAQNTTITIDSIKTSQPHEETIYYALQRSWIANQEPSYLSLAPYVSSIDKRRIPLTQGEGANSNFNLVEANINLQFPLFFGRRGQSYSYLFKTNRITFDYNGNFRMTLDDSKPLTPGNNKIGLSWYWSFYNNQTGWFGNKIESDNSELTSLTNKNLVFYNFLLRAHHYSNGQAPGFYYYPDENNLDFFRNSYTGGDFSTNYLYFELTRGIYKNLGQLYQFSLGYRHDLGTDTSTFAFSKEQEKSFGRNRLFFKYDYRSRKKEFKLFGKSKFNYHSHYRLEIEHILGNLESFQANLINDNNEYRTGIKTLFELAPTNHRAIGYFASGYYGRDYLNIRYDDIIYSLQIGLTLSIDKYFAPN